MEPENSKNRLNENVAESDGLFSIDAKYCIAYTEEGVTIDITPETGGGEPLTPEFVIYDLQRRGIEGLKEAEILAKIKRREAFFKLAEPQPEKTYDSDAAAAAARDEMSARMMLLPPSKDGRKRSAEEIKEILSAKWNITNGIDLPAIMSAVEDETYFKTIKIAQGRPPVKGKDGYLTFLFKTEHNYAPRILDDGTADYKNLDIFESVSENEAVIERHPPEDGVNGYTVKGRELPAQKGLTAKLPKGRNTRESEDGKSLIATKSGRVDFIAGRVEISDVYNIRGDVDLSVGNIDFTGDLVIEGNVISGLTLKATGSIEVRGMVDAATIIAGKGIVLKNGIQGVGRGLLRAGGNIAARFIERCAVEAGGDVISDYIVQCTVNAMGSVTMKGHHGKIISSVVRAGREVIARSIGSPLGDATVIDIGIDTEMRAKLVDMENKRIAAKAQLEKLENYARVLPANVTDSPEKAVLRKKLLDSKDEAENEYYAINEEIERIKEVLSQKSGGKVHVLQTIYQDVKIIIDSIQYIVKSSIDFVTFRYREGEIVFSACEIKSSIRGVLKCPWTVSTQKWRFNGRQTLPRKS